MGQVWVTPDRRVEDNRRRRLNYRRRRWGPADNFDVGTGARLCGQSGYGNRRRVGAIVRVSCRRRVTTEGGANVYGRYVMVRLMERRRRYGGILTICEVKVSAEKSRV